MTRLFGVEEDSVDRSSVSVAPARVSLKAPTLGTGFVDGAWWPHSRDLVSEAPGLVAALAGRLSAVSRVVYHLGYWDSAPSRLDVGGRTVKLDGYRFQPIHTVYIIGDHRDRLVLLVVPPGTNTDYAHETMATAATANNASTADQLLLHMNIPSAIRPADSDAAVAWESEGAAPPGIIPSPARHLPI